LPGLRAQKKPGQESRLILVARSIVFQMTGVLKTLGRWIERSVSRNSYWLTRFVTLRLLGLVYTAAFLSLARQVLPLLGSKGLTPSSELLHRRSERTAGGNSFLIESPTLFRFGISDRALLLFSWVGVALSVVVMCGYANAIMLVSLWILYMSFVNIGQIWYGYGWEIQLLETGAIAVFFVPILDGRPFPRRAPPLIIIWLFRWLAFRIMLGAGLIKLRGDPCWRDLTCLLFHYETQPIPNPLSRTFHFLPAWFQKFGVIWNHFIEILVPWFGVGPRVVRDAAGVLLVTFQGLLILSGNLSFLNYLTIVSMLAYFDDSLLAKILPKRLVCRAQSAVLEAEKSHSQQWFAAAYALLVAWLSIAPTKNLLSGMQVMNRSFDPFRLVNTYGAFGSVGRHRNEIIFEGTSDEIIGPDTVWREYEFPYKPGDPGRRPGVIAPLQPRLDWQIWFAAMATPERYPWTIHFIWKLLHNDSGTLSLLANNPFPDEPPRHIRALLYRYEFARPGNSEGAWWKRRLLREWLPPISVESSVWRRTREFYGWPAEISSVAGSS
jgi:hypothetical protein